MLVRLGACDPDEWEYAEELVDAVESWRRGLGAVVAEGSGCVRLREGNWVGITETVLLAEMKESVETERRCRQLAAYLLQDRSSSTEVKTQQRERLLWTRTQQRNCESLNQTTRAHIAWGGKKGKLDDNLV